MGTVWSFVDCTTLVSMNPCSKSLSCATCAGLVLAFVCAGARSQTIADEAPPSAHVIDSLQLTPAAMNQLHKEMADHDYIAAERLLIAEIERDPHSPRSAHLLAYAGTVYFLNHDYLNAAIAWKKSEAIAPLDRDIQFSLAMAYIRIGHREWARPVLEVLAAHDEKNSLFPYWLGRLDYDGQQYNDAIRHFQHAIELDPKLARAYDNLGLCYYYENQNELAVKNYEKAIELGRETEHPSAWPYLNLAVAQQFLNRMNDSEKNLREAIRLDPKFAKAYFQLGTVLDDLGRPKDALKELRQAAQLDPTYAEPHMAMARILHRLGQEAPAREETASYLRLRQHSTP